MIRHLLKGCGRARRTTIRASCSTCTAATCPARTRCAATTTPTRSTSASSAPAPAARCWPNAWPGQGWRVVIIEAGPFWHPDEDWVSDEAGSHELYWNQKRIIGGADPIEMGKNNSGRGVGGSMVHYAGYCPRFHPSDFQTQTLDGVGADWPIAYEELRPTTRRSNASCPSPARTGRGATRTAIRSPPPGLRGGVGAVARRHRPGHHHARRTGRDRQRHLREPPALHLPRLLPAGLQGQRQGQPVRHPPARRARPPRRDPGRLHGGPGRDRRMQRPGGRGDLHPRRRPVERMQRAKVVAVAGYSIETPRLLLNSTSAPLPERACATTRTRSAAT